KKRWPDYEAELREPRNENNIVCSVSEEDGRLLPRVSVDGRTYHLSSIYTDSVMLERWSEFVNLNLFESVVYFFGLGTGMYVRELLSRVNENPERKVSVFVYEPDGVILGELMKYYDLTDILADERVTLAIGCVDEGLLRSWTTSHINYNNVRNAGSACYLNYPRIYPEIRKQYDHDLEYLLTDYYGNTGFKMSLTKLVYSNTLDNIGRMADSLLLDPLMNSLPEDLPVFVVSSGPSLSKNINELKRAKGKSLIIGVDSSLGVFDKTGLLPDIYVTIDPSKKKENFSFDWIPEVRAVVGMSSPEYVVKDGQKYYMLCSYDRYTGQFIVSHSKEKPYHLLIQGGGSVATWAFSLAIAMGARKLIFVGQDLAYTGDKAHAAEVAVDDDAMLSTVDDTDIYGEPIRSSRQLVSYRKWFEHAIEQCDGLEAIDATEGGAYIRGTEIATLKDVIDKYCVKEWDPEESIFTNDKLFSEEEKAEYLEYLKAIPEKMDEIMGKSRKLISNYDKIEKQVRRGTVSGEKLKKLLALGSELADEIEENTGFTYIDMLNSESEVNVETKVNNVDSDAGKDILNVCALGREHTENILKTAEIVKKDFSELAILRGDDE
ncbi:MAG: motility associated factor glycosyltransferase family protein, partial [Lachnospiraceae bacterium]|nr:motility associated factor glycosyltransferase family protein [Lachnospiraceae bacterium]